MVSGEKLKRILDSRKITKLSVKQIIGQLTEIFKASEFTLKEKIKITLIKMFRRRRVKNVCKLLYNFNLNSQTRMFKRIVYSTYAEGIVLENLAEFHLMGITKCEIKDNNWKSFLSLNGKIKKVEDNR